MSVAERQEDRPAPTSQELTVREATKLLSLLNTRYTQLALEVTNAVHLEGDGDLARQLRDQTRAMIDFHEELGEGVRSLPDDGEGQIMVRTTGIWEMPMLQLRESEGQPKLGSPSESKERAGKPSQKIIESDKTEIDGLSGEEKSQLTDAMEAYVDERTGELGVDFFEKTWGVTGQTVRTRIGEMEEELGLNLIPQGGKRRSFRFSPEEAMQILIEYGSTEEIPLKKK